MNCPYYLALARVLTGMQPNPSKFHTGIAANYLIGELKEAEMPASEIEEVVEELESRAIALGEIDSTSAKNLAFHLNCAAEVVQQKSGKKMSGSATCVGSDGAVSFRLGDV